MPEGPAPEAALFTSPCGRQCGTGQSPELSLPSSPSWAPSPCLTKAFNLPSLLSTMEISCLFLGLVVRIKCDEGNECKRPYSNARSGDNCYPSHALPHPFPRAISRADLNSWPPTPCCSIRAPISTFPSLSLGALLGKQILDRFTPAFSINVFIAL